MFRCLFIRRKLCDFVTAELTPKQKESIERHLEACSGCRRKTEELRKLFDLAATGVKLPQPNEAFWEKFQAELNQSLDRKLDTESAPAVEPLRHMRRHYLLRPALAYASVSLIMMVTVFSLYRYYQPKIAAYQDEQIVEEILFLEELNGTNGTAIFPLGDAYIQEMDILSRYGA